MSVFILAEAGVNHNGSLETALRLIDVAAEAGVDAVKFQTFVASNLVAAHAAKANYQLRTTDNLESQKEMIRKLELSMSDHQELRAHARSRAIDFLSTPFDSESLQLLIGPLGMTTIKVSSGDLTNAPFLLEIARAAHKVVLSTGMATLAEIEAALGVLAFGGTALPSAQPGRAAFEESYASDAGQQWLRGHVTLLHCTTEYPAPIFEVNLRAMDTLGSAFGLPVGYSDHTPGIHIPIAAVARGACLIEKHFTLDRSMPGPDHMASLEPHELRDMVLAIRDVELSMGDGIKRPTASEWKNRLIARKSLVAVRDVDAGQPLEIACKRPGSGKSPFDYWEFSGRPASRAYQADGLIDA